MTTEVWTSTRGRISEATRIILQEALEEENKKDTPSFGSEDLEELHRSGTEAGLLGIYNFPGSVYATDGSNDRGVMGAGFFKLDEHRGGCCQLGRGEKGNSSNRAELGAACLALEDSKRQQNRKPVILLSDSACFLSSSQKWTGEGESSSMHGNPDADIMRDIVQLLRERIDHGGPQHTRRVEGTLVDGLAARAICVLWALVTSTGVIVREEARPAQAVVRAVRVSGRVAVQEAWVRQVAVTERVCRAHGTLASILPGEGVVAAAAQTRAAAGGARGVGRARVAARRALSVAVEVGRAQLTARGCRFAALLEAAEESGARCAVLRGVRALQREVARLE